jgi:hypothetical protein
MQQHRSQIHFITTDIFQSSDDHSCESIIFYIIIWFLHAHLLYDIHVEFYSHSYYGGQ